MTASWPAAHPVRTAFRFDRPEAGWSKHGMTKLLSVLMVLAMAVQVIKPLGLPGLRQRRDFWKIALGAMAGLALVIALREAAEALG